MLDLMVVVLHTLLQLVLHSTKGLVILQLSFNYRPVVCSLQGQNFRKKVYESSKKVIVNRIHMFEYQKTNSHWPSLKKNTGAWHAAHLVMAWDGDEQQCVYHIAVNRLMKDCLEKRGPLAMGQKTQKKSVEIFKKSECHYNVTTDIQISKKQARANLCWKEKQVIKVCTPLATTRDDNGPQQPQKKIAQVFVRLSTYTQISKIQIVTNLCWKDMQCSRSCTPLSTTGNNDAMHRTVRLVRVFSVWQPVVEDVGL